jgi:hypothetical protein
MMSIRLSSLRFIAVNRTGMKRVELVTLPRIARIFLGIIMAAAPAAAITSCGGNISAPTPPAPTQIGDAHVTFAVDPCIDIGDEAVDQAGYDPSTRVRADSQLGSHALIGCSFQLKNGRERELSGPRTMTVRVTDLGFEGLSTELRNRFADRSGLVAPRDAPAGGSRYISYHALNPTLCGLVEEKSNNLWFDVLIEIPQGSRGGNCNDRWALSDALYEAMG